MKYFATLLANDVAAMDLSLEISQNILTTNNVWMMLSTALVFIMHLGFAGVEAGFGQAKNTVNILFKNTVTPIIGIISYAAIGFYLMYPGFETPGWLSFDFAGWNMFWFSPASADVSSAYADGGYTYWTDFLFQAMFAATAATIVSGAIAERVKLGAYLVFTLFFVGIVYPLIGSWKWGGGALDAMGFYDFAGSTLVHSVGGWGALAGVILVGPRIGKYVNGKIVEKPGASVPLAVIGVFLLWLGWFGFNGGSVLSADPGLVSFVLVTTSLAACAGGLGGFLTAYFAFKRLDLGMVLNGILAGLVAITAGADVINPGSAVLVGLIGGVLVVLSAILLDKFHLDDVVGAVSVHLTCGVWGTLAVGIFSTNPEHTLLTQLIGVAICGVTAFTAAFVIFFVLKKTVGIRVSEEHERTGLDSHEHGIRGYTIVYDE
ncbi:MAG TPA: ammonium transporter [Algoriphagus sp.]|jgi:Amt family ammonium transporter|uniref:Ammonium transporter n=3 Tax=Algoriphagus TaxID=246875 RepID=A0A1I5A6F5_9BACT|nr:MULTISPECIES: ammonium transporter [Algoriphagus]MAL12445.1 ammonium transporter [Algoriphagus sp.]MAN88314.1 ammonium transporter [Algoriphagus sp.]SFN57769.1 ammonium transporter [Algoriphagus ornithinivorans]HCB45777.1 ammonium transporter [Algoriphagus sp.]HCD89846.1 ammonium transporter [Algoriphagus sp.]|tara:strand:+ start:2230 stop:3525 length:1296 start_codon:yes stop_codon:yes gene_type:complete